MSVEPVTLEGPSKGRRYAIVLGGIVLGWFFVTEVAVEGWYRWRESQVPKTQPWPIVFPTEATALSRGFRVFKEHKLDREQELLKYDSAESATWRDESGYYWTCFYLQWKPDKRLNQTDLAHNPTSCFPAAGLKLVSAEADTTVDLGGIPIPFRTWIFSMDGSPVYVFTATRRERELQRFDLQGSAKKKLLDKLSKPWFGNRSNPLQTLELVVFGPHSLEVARARLAEEVSDLQKH